MRLERNGTDGGRRGRRRIRSAPGAVQSNHLDGATVFSATMARERELLGERVTAWLAAHPEKQVADAVVTQSSDAEFHCITITLFWREAG